ncbi:MAG: hypothetical protein R2793_08155 [Flavobacteriaceae bacterium]
MCCIPNSGGGYLDPQAVHHGLPCILEGIFVHTALALLKTAAVPAALALIPKPCPVAM